MESEILDKAINESPPNKRHFFKIGMVSIVAVVLVFGIVLLRPYLPDNLLDHNGTQIKTIGLLILILVLFLSFIFPAILNKINPRIGGIPIVIYTGLLVFSIDAIFRLIYNVFVLDFGLSLDYLGLLKGPALMACIAMLFANIKISSLRGKGRSKPILFLLLVVFVMGFLVRKYAET